MIPFTLSAQIQLYLFCPLSPHRALELSYPTKLPSASQPNGIPTEFYTLAAIKENGLYDVVVMVILQ